MAKTHVLRQNTDIEVTGLTIGGTPILATSVVLAEGEVVDLNGEKLVIDADTDTYIQQTGGPSGTDDSFGIVVAGAEDFRVTANTLTALSGSSIATNTIAETTAGTGVTIDGALIKDTIVHGRTSVVAAAVNGAITIPAYNQVIFFTKAGVAAMTIADPTTGTHDGVTLTFIAATANAHTLDNSAGSGFFSSGGSTKDVITLGGAIGDGFAIIAYLGKWYIDPRGVTNATLG